MRVLIVGASRGLGRALSDALSNDGHEVIYNLGIWTAQSSVRKPAGLWVPSQNGLIVERPQRQSATVRRFR